MAYEQRNSRLPTIQNGMIYRQKIEKRKTGKLVPHSSKCKVCFNVSYKLQEQGESLVKQLVSAQLHPD